MSATQTPTQRWMSLPRREQAKAIAAYKRLPFAVDEDTQRLLDEIAALKRRVRLLREEFYAAKMVARAGTTDVDALDRFVELLDLRKPIGRRR